MEVYDLPFIKLVRKVVAAAFGFLVLSYRGRNSTSGYEMASSSHLHRLCSMGVYKMET